MAKTPFFSRGARNANLGRARVRRSREWAGQTPCQKRMELQLEEAAYAGVEFTLSFYAK